MNRLYEERVERPAFVQAVTIPPSRHRRANLLANFSHLHKGGLCECWLFCKDSLQQTPSHSPQGGILSLSQKIPKKGLYFFGKA